MAQQAADAVDAGGKQKSSFERRRIGFVGCGKMAFAIAKGFMQSGACSKEDIIVSSPNALPNRIRFQEELGCAVTASNTEVVVRSQVVIIATKPHAVEKVISEAFADAKLNTLVVSIAAGITLERMHNAFSAKFAHANHSRPLANAILKIIRVVPNMPMQLGPGWGACCISSGPNVPDEDADYCRELFSTVAGLCVNVPESQLNIATALIGSGPAYIFILIESLADAAVMEGLPRDLAQKLAAQMVMGSAKMLCNDGDFKRPAVPSVLKDEICSPGGTTIAGLYELEKGGYRAAIMSSIHAATEKAHHLGRKS